MTEDKEYALYLGCVLPIQLPFLEKLARDILPKIGIETQDFDFSCCTTDSVRDISENAWLLSGARNLAIAEEKGLDILSFCNGCSKTLTEVHHQLKDKELRNEVNQRLGKIGKEYRGKVKVIPFMELFDQHKDQIKSLITNPLRGLKIATHTGCHLLRPSDQMNYDDAEHPVKFDNFVRLLGGFPVDYQHKTLCCGSSQTIRMPKMAHGMVNHKITELGEKGAEALAVCCPSCYLQYDRTQLQLKKNNPNLKRIPVVHSLQLLGLAMGMSHEEVFLKKNRSITPELIQQVGVILK
ncbi:MAG: CoB--CoM heterodisulfide reductase iron-sulfur subunit B family protein [Candidatus Ranarchaeia archaeon]|jgi:heterodisulfide reductase subunit B